MEQQEDEEDEEDEENEENEEGDETPKPTRRQTRGSSDLLDEKHVYEFLKEKEGWEYAGKGHQITPPDGSSGPMDEAQVGRVCVALPRVCVP